MSSENHAAVKMALEDLRTISQGPVGSILSAILASVLWHWQVRRWSRWISANGRKEGRERILREQKSTVRAAKCLSVIGLLIGWILYALGELSQYDLRGLGIGLGLMAIVPTLYIVVANMRHGTTGIKDGMVAFAIDQKMPARLLFWLLGICFVLGVVAAVSLIVG